MTIMNIPARALTVAAMILSLAGSALFLGGCARSAANIGSKVAVSAPPDSAVPSLKDRQERLSYALGMVLGNQFKDQSVAVDPKLYLRGLEDALAGGGTLLTESEARSAVNELQRDLKRQQAAAPTVPPVPGGIEISFKLDPRLTRGMYMGDRWVSPPTFTSTLQDGDEVTVEARAEGRDTKGRAMQSSPEWIPEVPEMVTVTPRQGNEVRITVQGEGESRLKVVGAGVSTDLLIKSIRRGDALQVEISQ